MAHNQQFLDFVSFWMEIWGANSASDVMKLRHAGHTDPGLTRDHNEDTYLEFAEENLFVVADGMGGHEKGEVASQLAVDSIREFFCLSTSQSVAEWPHAALGVQNYHACRLVSSIEYAHKKILEGSQGDQELSQMGTTVVCIYFAGSCAFIAHVGDSRCYRLYNGTLVRATRDHSLVDQIKNRRDLPWEVQSNLAAMKHIVSRALTAHVDADAEVELSIVVPRPGEKFLLCSDGLTCELADSEISQFLGQVGSPEQICQSLVDSANTKGGRDNITTVVIEFVEGEPDPEFGIGEEETIEAEVDPALAEIIRNET